MQLRRRYHVRDASVRVALVRLLEALTARRAGKGQEPLRLLLQLCRRHRPRQRRANRPSARTDALLLAVAGLLLSRLL